MARISNILNGYFAEQERKSLQAVKDYCEEEGWVEDYYNIFLPLYEKYGWEFIRDIGDIQWERVYGVANPKYEYEVIYLNLDRLSTLVEWNEKKQRFVAIQKGEQYDIQV